MKLSHYFLALACFSGCIRLQAQHGTLDYYLLKAKTNSPELNDFLNQIQSNTYDSLKLNAGKKPQVNLLGQILVAPTSNGYGYDAAVTNTGNYELVLGVNQNLFTRNILHPQYESIRLQSLSATNSVQTATHELQRSITTQYISAYSDLIQIAYTRKVLKLLTDESSVLKQLVEKGVYKSFDYTSLLLAEAAQQILVQQQAYQYRTDIYALNLLCGISDTAVPVIEAPVLNSKAQISVAASLFLVSFRIDSLQLNNRKLLTGSNYKPRLSWFADAGVLGSQVPDLYHNFGTSFGLNFSMPIYDGKQKQLEYKKITLAENTRDTYENYFKKQHQVQVIAITSELSENDQLILQTSKELQLSEDQIRFGKAQLDIGSLPVSDFILALRAYADIKNTLSQLQMKQMQLTNELNYWNW